MGLSSRVPTLMLTRPFCRYEVMDLRIKCTFDVTMTLYPTPARPIFSLSLCFSLICIAQKHKYVNSFGQSCVVVKIPDNHRDLCGTYSPLLLSSLLGLYLSERCYYDGRTVVARLVLVNVGAVRPWIVKITIEEQYSGWAGTYKRSLVGLQSRLVIRFHEWTNAIN